MRLSTTTHTLSQGERLLLICRHGERKQLPSRTGRRSRKRPFAVVGPSDYPVTASPLARVGSCQRKSWPRGSRTCSVLRQGACRFYPQPDCFHLCDFPRSRELFQRLHFPACAYNGIKKEKKLQLRSRGAAPCCTHYRLGLSGGLFRQNTYHHMIHIPQRGKGTVTTL